ncbi:MAG: LPS export ABC transporter periplasmic protein LptC [Crinalium sp.]
MLLLLGVSGCGGKKTTEKAPTENEQPTNIEGSLEFNNVTLEQADENGRPLWKVKAKRGLYTQNQKTARVENPTGDLFQDGKLVLRVSATEGEIQQDGQKVFLKGQIVATEIRNGLVLRGQELEWRPKEDLLIVRNNLTGSHPQLQASAKEARYFSRTQRMELFGQIVATTKDPSLQLRTEHLIWQVSQQIVIGDKRIKIDRYQGNQVTSSVIGNTSEVNLKTKIAKLKQNVELTSIEPPVKVNGNSVTWNLNNQVVVADQPVSIWHSQEQVRINGSQGQVDLQQKVAILSGNVQGVATRNQAKLKTNQLKWEFGNQLITAQGNVVYQQVNPLLSLAGSSGVGRLQDQTFVVTGSRGSKVVTEIIP